MSVIALHIRLPLPFSRPVHVPGGDVVPQHQLLHSGRGGSHQGLLSGEHDQNP